MNEEEALITRQQHSSELRKEHDEHEEAAAAAAPEEDSNEHDRHLSVEVASKQVAMRMVEGAIDPAMAVFASQVRLSEDAVSFSFFLFLCSPLN